MADEIYDALKGLAGLLDNISGIKAYEVVPDSLNQRQGVAAVLEYVPGEQLTLGDSSFMGRVEIRLIAMATLSNRSAQRALLQHMAPIGSKSIKAAMEKDTTWNNSVDDGRLDAEEPMGSIEPEDYPFHEAGPLRTVIINAKFLKTVA